MEALAAEAADTGAAPAVRRDALAALIVLVQGSEGVDCTACVELGVQVLDESPPAAATVRRHALWLLAHAHPTSAALPTTTAATLQTHIEPTSPPRVRAVALRTAACLVGRKGASLPSALIAAAWDGLSCSAECVRLATLELVAAVAAVTGDAVAPSDSESEGQEERLQELAKGIGSVADRLSDGSVTVRVAAARAVGQLNCVRGRVPDARWLGLVITPTAEANSAGALEADDASEAVENAVTRKRRRRERQLTTRAQQKNHAAEEAKSKDTDPMTDWLIPDQADEEEIVDEEDGEVAELVPAQQSEREGAGALGMALDDESWKVRQAAVQAIRMLCCAPTSLAVGDSGPKGSHKAKQKLKGKGRKEEDAGTPPEGAWDVPLQLSRRILVYLHDMVGDTSADVQRSAVRAVRALLVAHRAAQPPLALSDRQLVALVSPSLLDADQQQLLRQERIASADEAAGADSWRRGCSVSATTNQHAMGVSLATHRLLGSAAHPSVSTIHRTLRALARAAAARDDLVTSQHATSRSTDTSTQGQCGVELAMREVRSIFQAAAALGKHAEHARQIRPAGMGALLGTVAEDECTDDNGAVVAVGDASSENHNHKRRRNDADDCSPLSSAVDCQQRTLVERCVAWVAVFHAAAISPQLQAELPPQDAAAMYATIASANHYGGDKLLPPRQELRGCEALVRATSDHDEIEDQSSEMEEREGFSSRHTAEQREHALAGAAEHAQARVRTACLRAVQAALVACANPVSFESTAERTSADSAANAMPVLAGPRMSGPDVNVAVAEGIAVVQQARQMVAALLLPYGRRASPRHSAAQPAIAGRGVSQCRYTMGYAGLSTTLLRLIKILAGRDLTERQQGAAAAAAWRKAQSEAESGLRDAEELLQCSYELQYGFSFGSGQSANGQVCAAAALHEIEMRQVRLFAHAASVIIASSAADCRPALCRALTSRIASLRSTIAAVATARYAGSDSHSGLGDSETEATKDDSSGEAAGWMRLFDAAAHDRQGSIDADRDGSVSSRKEREEKATELMAAVWSSLMQIFSFPSSSASSTIDTTDKTQADIQRWDRPLICYATLAVSLPRDRTGNDAPTSSSTPPVVLSTLPWQLRLHIKQWNIPTHAALALRVTLRRQGKHQPCAQDGTENGTGNDDGLIVLPLAALQLPESQGQAAHCSAAEGLPLPLVQDGSRTQGESADAVLQMGAAGVEWDDHLAETAACSGATSSAAGATHHSCDRADVTEWETSATVVLPRDVPNGLYTASVGLVRLFCSEVQPKKLATPQQRDTRRGMVSISEACDLSIAIWALRSGIGH